MRLIEFLRNTALYKKTYSPYVERKMQRINAVKADAFKKGGLSLLTDFAELMNNNAIIYWLEFGSLLGAYRDCNFIKNDNDIDVGVYLKDANMIYNILTSNGYELVREFHVRGENGLEQTYSKFGTTIDLFFFFEKGNYLICNGFYDAISQKVARYFDIAVCEFQFSRFEVRPFIFLGVRVGVPVNTEKHIIEVYGDSYKIYDPNFKDGYNKTKYKFGDKVGCGYFLK